MSAARNDDRASARPRRRPHDASRPSCPARYRAAAAVLGSTRSRPAYAAARSPRSSPRRAPARPRRRRLVPGRGRAGGRVTWTRARHRRHTSPFSAAPPPPWPPDRTECGSGGRPSCSTTPTSRAAARRWSAGTPGAPGRAHLADPESRGARPGPRRGTGPAPVRCGDGAHPGGVRRPARRIDHLAASATDVARVVERAEGWSCRRRPRGQRLHRHGPEDARRLPRRWPPVVTRLMEQAFGSCPPEFQGCR